MKNHPLPVIIVSILFILAGCAGFISHIKEVFGSNNNLNETIGILFLETLAVVCGLLLILRFTWSRWLAVAWMAFHVMVSAFDSASEMMVHLVLLIIVSVLLFLPVSTAYFRNKTNSKR